MLEITREEVTGWAASFGWSTSPVELRPDAAEQWAIRVDGGEGVFAADIVWVPSPANMLTVRINIQVHDDHRARLNSLNVADRIMWLTDLRLNMVRYHPAVDCQVFTSDDDETLPPMPQSLVVEAHVVGESASRNDLLDAFFRVQRAITDVVISIDRLALGRMLP